MRKKREKRKSEERRQREITERERKDILIENALKNYYFYKI